MDSKRIVDIFRLWTVIPSRRDILRGLAGAGLGLVVRGTPHNAEGKKKHKHKDKKPKLQRNAFGCVDVGANAGAMMRSAAPASAREINQRRAKRTRVGVPATTSMSASRGKGRWCVAAWGRSAPCLMEAEASAKRPPAMPAIAWARKLSATPA